MEVAMGLNRFHLSILGTWPEPREMSRTSKLISNLVFWISTINSITFLCAPQTAYLITQSSSLDEVVENLSINVPTAFAMVKLVVLHTNKQALTSLLQQVLTDWSGPIMERDRKVMLKNAELSRIMCIASSILTYSMLVSFFYLHLSTNVEETSERNLGGLLHTTIFPYDTRKSPNFEITWLGQFAATILTAICYSFFDTFFAALVLHLCGQLTILGTALENLVETTENQNFVSFQKRLGFVVYRHNQLSRFADTIEDCFNVTYMIQTFMCTAMFCFTSYRLLTTVGQEDQNDLPLVGLPFFFIHEMYTMFHLFIYCYVGETLLGESTGIAKSAYNCKWYKLPPKQAISLVNVICRGQISLQITAGKFSPLSMELLNAVVKTAAGYLSVLLAMND